MGAIVSAGNSVPAVRTYPCTVVHPRHDGKRVERAERPWPGGWRGGATEDIVIKPLLFVLQDQDTGVILFMGRVSDPSLKG